MDAAVPGATIEKCSTASYGFCAERRALERFARALSTLPDLPHRRFQAWVRSGVLRMTLEVLAEDLRERGQIDLNE
jgi:hypothetical protein